MKRTVIAHIKARSKHSLLTINCWHKKKANLAYGHVPSPMCSVSRYAFMHVLLLLVGWGIAGPCFTCTCGAGAHNRDVRDDRWACPTSGVTSDPCQMPCLGVRGRRSKVTQYSTRPWQQPGRLHQVIVQTVGLEERQRRCEVGVVVRRCCAHRK